YQLLLILALYLPATTHAHESDLIEPMAAAVTAYLDSLDGAQLKQTRVPFTSQQRSDWHYVPKQRKGLPWAAMTPEQKHLSKQVFVIVFSESGHDKAKGVIGAEHVLWERSGRSKYRNPENYFITVFGEPSTTKSWGVAIEGHHLSINLTVVDGHEVFVTPSFMGSNPDRYTHNESMQKRPLAAEADQALKLIAMLNTEQLSKAKISEDPIREIITRGDRKVAAFAPSGLLAAEMTREQVDQLRVLILEYVARYKTLIADDDMGKIDAAGFEKITFTWAGSKEQSKPMYYRVQGPTFLLEYANVQNEGNHSHSVWRDFENDFGYDALKRHIEESH
ncbi:MAG TPA: hypothetical protein DCX06_13260, partial [Opitutae bacterium]|nr:hypothetical protein [Opitutae bacterium]